eukprot:765526-Hanusia_phi.AAC.6
MRSEVRQNLNPAPEKLKGHPSQLFLYYVTCHPLRKEPEKPKHIIMENPIRVVTITGRNAAAFGGTC